MAQEIVVSLDRQRFVFSQIDRERAIHLRVLGTYTFCTLRAGR
jgi:hypothetical protein